MKTYRIEKCHHGRVVNMFAAACISFHTAKVLKMAQDELLDIYNQVADVFAESWREAVINNAKGRTTADVTFVDGDVMGFDYDGYSYNIVEHHSYTVYYCDGINVESKLETFLSKKIAEDWIRREMRDVTRVDAENPCTEDVFTSSAVACYRIYEDEILYDEPQAPVYESDYFYID